MKCSNCGNEIAEDSVFCEHCGKQIGQNDSRECMINIRWLLLVSIVLFSTANVFLVALSKEHEDAMYFDWYGWIVPLASAIIFIITFILCVKKKVAVVFTVFVGLFMLTNVWILHRNLTYYANTPTTGWSRAELQILQIAPSDSITQRGENNLGEIGYIGYISNGDMHTWTTEASCDRYIETMKMLVPTWGEGYTVWNTRIRNLYEYQGIDEMSNYIIFEILLLILYLIYAPIAYKMKWKF